MYARKCGTFAMTKASNTSLLVQGAKIKDIKGTPFMKFLTSWAKEHGLYPTGNEKPQTGPIEI